ncbi:HAD family hydrolase [Halorientalis pallida]|uniref:HAD family hydrolase n=1 Tax=Halorientalis pallida TaxID=2479928 RepID=A0A498KXX1_9EURY|nr:HAD-IA family hydrolase [Halorientalis pallida]RXK47812.1 HAD family hydrolase [Halorientalis pallida]
MAAFDAVCFDMDGVTVETAAAWYEIERNHVLPSAVATGTPPPDAIRALGVDDAYDRLRSLDGVSLAVDRETFATLYEERVEEVYRERATLMPGYQDLLKTLAADGLALGLVSASKRAWVEIVLDRFELQDAFEVVVGADDIGGPSKPDPGIYEHAADQLGVTPGRAIAVEDSPHGVTAATAAGMYCIALRGDGNAEADLTAADTVVTDPATLQAKLRAITAE